MIIDLVNTYLRGGAGTAARRLHVGLRAAGVDSRLWLARVDPKDAEVDHVRPISWTAARSPISAGLAKVSHECWRAVFRKRLRKALRGRRGHREIFTHPRRPSATPYASSSLNGDLLHLHWVEEMIDYPSFFDAMPAELPIVWTLHDMNPFTGGCHHADECQRFVSSCEHCPQLGRPGPNDLSHRGFTMKRAAYRDKRLHVVTPSKWLEERARRSELLGRASSIETIHNGLDTRTFAPRDKRAARMRWSLPADRLVVGFGAVSLTYRRKGFVELRKALSLLPAPARYLGLSLGSGGMPAGDEPLPEIRAAGYLSRDRDLVDFYSALDLFVMTSMAENMPQTVVEAMACGVPVVAFGVGGIPEIVVPHRTGLLAESGDCGQLARHVKLLADEPDLRRRMGIEARRGVAARFDQTRQAAKYIDLYRRLLEQPRQVRRGAPDLTARIRSGSRRR